MHIKRFEAPSMLEAVRKVKDELGPDALILSSRTLRRGGALFGLMGSSVVEVTAALDRDTRRAAEGFAPTERAQQAAGAAGVSGAGPDPSWRELRVTRALLEPLHEELRALRASVQSLRLPDTGADEVLRELAELRRVAADRAGCAAPGDAAAQRLAGRLLGAGLAPRHAFRLAGEAADGSSASGAPSDEPLRRALARALDARLRPLRPDDGTRVDLFVGPTGVGKTTTLAKVAAREAGAGEAISLVTTDTFRIGADAQLRTYADLLGVAFDVAASHEDLARCLRGVGGRALVDTAGRPRGDDQALAELVGARRLLGQRARIHLVVSATTKDEDLREELRRYRVVEPDSLVVTKLDESASLGSVANLLLDDAVPPVSWITDGQRVPEDLAIPDPEAFAGRILGAAA